jgi:hypothetical protein
VQVADTVLEADAVSRTPKRLGCTVVARAFNEGQGATRALFRRGFPGGAWKTHEFDGTNPDSAYAVAQPTVWCEIDPLPRTVARDARFAVNAVAGFYIGCEPQRLETITDSASSRGGGYKTTRVGALSDSIVHLANADSIEWQSFGLAQAPGRPDGLIITYHPFFALQDTGRVIRIALVLFDSLRKHFVGGEPPFVVLRAIDLRAAERTTDRKLRAYGVVIEKRTDGHWYRLGEASPVRP